MRQEPHFVAQRDQRLHGIQIGPVAAAEVSPAALARAMQELAQHFRREGTRLRQEARDADAAARTCGEWSRTLKAEG